MGRPIGSVNREKPFNDALRIALKRDPRRLPRIAEKLAEKAEEGDLAAIREIADRLDGKPTQQVVDQRDVPAHQLTDAQLLEMIAASLTDAELERLIASSDPNGSKTLLIPPTSRPKT